MWRDAAEDMLEDYAFCLRFYPYESAINFVIGFGIGLFTGGSIMWWAVG